MSHFIVLSVVFVMVVATDNNKEHENEDDNIYKKDDWQYQTVTVAIESHTTHGKPKIKFAGVAEILQHWRAKPVMVFARWQFSQRFLGD